MLSLHSKTFAQIVILAILIPSAMDNAKAQGMMDNGMMGSEHHREMMQRMMGGRNMMMGRTEAPSPEQLATITAYLQEHAQKAITEELADELQQTEGGSLFSDLCSRCHALPDPAQHTAGKWPSVVERMRRYMTEAGQDLPTDKDWEKIISFLQRNSGLRIQPRERE